MSHECNKEREIDSVCLKLDYVASDLSDLKVTMSRLAAVSENQQETLKEQHVSLKDHMSRTHLLELRVEQGEKLAYAQKQFYKILMWLIPVIISATAVIMKVSTLF